MEFLTAIADIAAIIHHEILLFALFGLVVGGLDDLLIDLLFLAHTARRKLFIYTRHARMTGASLPPSHAPGTIAIFIPAWDESSVIGPMLRNCLNTWQQGSFRIFVGAYPNDPATIEIVTRIASADGRVHPVILPHPGKTTKADCLNHIYQAMLREEQAGIM